MKVREWVIPLFLALCLILGGSVQNAWQVAFLQLSGLGILCWALMWPKGEETDRSSRVPMLLAGAAAGLILLQLVPLPPAIWTELPGRNLVVEGFQLLGATLPAMPISLVPASTLATGFALLVPVAVYTAMIRQRAFKSGYLVAVIGLVALAGTLLGILQKGGRFYLYEISNEGIAGGFFANSNHMGLLMVMALPLIAGVAVERWRSKSGTSRKWGIIGLVVVAVGVLLIAAITNGSLAILALSPTVVLASALLPGWHRRTHIRRILGTSTAVALVFTVTAVAWLPDRLSAGESASFSTRTEIWTKSLRAAGDFFPVGSGVGTFDQVYFQYEDPHSVDRFYVNHAHNDYLEVAVESGLAGIILICLFLVWWGRETLKLWSLPGQSAIARAASIASGAVLAHSIVDYPLRTPALAALFAACCALMVLSAERVAKHGELRKSRHLRVY